jgi:hypothetical protein
MSPADREGAHARRHSSILGPSRLATATAADSHGWELVHGRVVAPDLARDHAGAGCTTAAATDVIDHPSSILALTHASIGAKMPSGFLARVSRIMDATRAKAVGPGPCTNLQPNPSLQPTARPPSDEYAHGPRQKDDAIGANEGGPDPVRGQNLREVRTGRTPIIGTEFRLPGSPHHCRQRVTRADTRNYPRLPNVEKSPGGTK